MADEDREFDIERARLAIGKVCDVFDEMQLTLYERWHVCECIEVSALSIMGENMRELCEEIKARDMGSQGA